MRVLCRALLCMLLALVPELALAQGRVYLGVDASAANVTALGDVSGFPLAVWFQHLPTSGGVAGQCLLSGGPGGHPTWGACTGGAGAISDITVGPGLTGGGTTGTVNIGLGTVPIANGGTGSTTGGGALDSLGSFSSLGFVDRTGTATYSIVPDPLTAGHGGTGQTTLAANGVVISEGTSPFHSIAPGTAGYCFESNGPGTDPGFAPCGGGGGTSFPIDYSQSGTSPLGTAFEVDRLSGGLSDAPLISHTYNIDAADGPDVNYQITNLVTNLNGAGTPPTGPAGDSYTFNSSLNVSALKSLTIFNGGSQAVAITGGVQKNLPSGGVPAGRTEYDTFNFWGPLTNSTNLPSSQAGNDVNIELDHNTNNLDDADDRMIYQGTLHLANATGYAAEVGRGLYLSTAGGNTSWWDNVDLGGLYSQAAIDMRFSSTAEPKITSTTPGSPTNTITVDNVLPIASGGLAAGGYGFLPSASTNAVTGITASAAASGTSLPVSSAAALYSGVQYYLYDLTTPSKVAVGTTVTGPSSGNTLTTSASTTVANGDTLLFARGQKAVTINGDSYTVAGVQLSGQNTTAGTVWFTGNVSVADATQNNLIVPAAHTLWMWEGQSSGPAIPPDDIAFNRAGTINLACNSNSNCTGLTLQGGLTVTGALAGLVTANGTTTARGLSARFADVANVLNYGADPTGVADSAPAFRSAMASNRRVTVPPGTYLFNSTQTAPCCAQNPTAVLVQSLSNFEIDGYGATIEVGSSIPLSSAFQFDSDKNFIVRGLTIQGNTTGLTSSQENVGITLTSDVDFIVRDIHFTSGFNAGAGAAFDGDWWVNGTLSNVTIDGSSFCADVAYLKNVSFDNFEATGVGAGGTGAGNSCFSVIVDPPNASDNHTGVSYTETTHVSYRNNNEQNYNTGLFLATGTYYTLVGNHWHDNPGTSTGSVQGIGVQIGYVATNSAGVPPQHITINGDTFANNGATVPGYGLLVNGSSITNSDLIGDIAISGSTFDNNDSIGAGALGVTHISSTVQPLGNIYSGSLQTTGIDANLAAVSQIFSDQAGDLALNTGALVVGAPTGGNKGAGTINATGIYVNGVAVGVGGGSGNDLFGYSVLDAGAVCDGATDDTTKLTAALTSGNLLITIPQGKKCYSATGIVVPPRVTLRGLDFDPEKATLGSAIVCAANVTCVTVEDLAHDLPARVEDLVVETNNSSTPTSGDCILVDGGQGVVLQQVAAYNCYDGYYWKANSPYGARSKMHEVYSGDIADAHVVVDTYPNLRIDDSIFGSNGSGDLAANAMIRITGGVAGTAAGPNTLYVVNSHFNQGGNSVAYWLQFSACTSTCVGTIDAREWVFIGNHVENVGTAFITSDSTWNYIDKLQLTNNRFSQAVPFWALNSATGLINSQIVGNVFATSSWSLSPTPAFSGDEIDSNQFATPVTFTSGAAASTLTFIGDAVTSGSLTLGGAWRQFVYSPPDFASGGGSVVNNGTGTIINLGAAASGNFPSLTVTGFLTESVGTLTPVGTTQSGAAAITTQTTVCTSVSSTANAVLLPSVAAGTILTVVNGGNYPVSVFPQSGQSIGNLAANAAVQIGAGSKATFVSTSSQWYAGT